MVMGWFGKGLKVGMATVLVAGSLVKPVYEAEALLVTGSLALAGGVYVAKKVATLTLIHGGKSAVGASAVSTGFMTAMNMQKLTEMASALLMNAPNWVLDQLEGLFAEAEEQGLERYSVSRELVEFFVLNMEPVLMEIALEHGLDVEGLAEFREFGVLEESRVAGAFFNSPNPRELILNSGENALNAVFFDRGEFRLIRPGGGGNSTISIGAELLAGGAHRAFFVRTTPLVTDALGLSPQTLRFANGTSVNNVVFRFHGEATASSEALLEVFGLSPDHDITSNLEAIEHLIPLYFVLNQPGLAGVLEGSQIDLRENFEAGYEAVGGIPVAPPEWLGGLTVDGLPIWRDADGNWVTDAGRVTDADRIAIEVPGVGVEGGRWVERDPVVVNVTTPEIVSPPLPGPGVDFGLNPNFFQRLVQPIVEGVRALVDFFVVDMDRVAGAVSEQVAGFSRELGLPPLEIAWSDTGNRFQDVWVDFSLFGHQVRFLLVHASQVNAYVDVFRWVLLGLLGLLGGLRLIRRSPSLVSDSSE